MENELKIEIFRPLACIVMCQVKGQKLIRRWVMDSLNYFRF